MAKPNHLANPWPLDPDLPERLDRIIAALHLHFVTPTADITWDFTIDPADRQRLIDENFAPIRRLESFLGRMPSVRDSYPPPSSLYPG